MSDIIATGLEGGRCASMPIVPPVSSWALRWIGLSALFLLSLGGSGCLGFHQGAMPGEPPDATWAEVDGVRLRYVDTGSPPLAGDRRGEPAIVLLHGYASSLDVWAAAMPSLALRRRVVAVDLMGFGWSDRPASGPGRDYSPAGQAALVHGLLDRLGVGRVSVVGHSWGAAVALAAVAARPERVDRVALYDAWVYDDQLPPFFLWARSAGLGELLFALYYAPADAAVARERLAGAFYDPDRHVTPELVAAVGRAFDRPGTRAAALAVARGQRFHEQESAYASVSQPVLLLWGRQDAVAPAWVAERLDAELPDSRLVTYPRCGHLPMIEAAEASTRDLASFLLAQGPP